ncbi:MAG: hypothetical protein IPG17_12945 [Sandaracinaceae bacterium]|jgi:membrane protein DedA with SNARE-associated domain|nr:hypothetical protein [Sandaracinaceae bacterium]MBP7682728.1 hypothetical protein [Deltaproteobacteria bacterium]MBK6809015.1 hypothetical protein [Sandaracinaceae bacterium]MBK7153438.1 hypothetical protein [Sandaracinaceae bacterium]MBK7772656.1 hypothetical protein [Sandaracinaceae bacterium]
MSDDASTEEEPRPAPLEAPPDELTAHPPASQRERRLAVVLVTLTTLVGGVGTALSPYLLVHHPAWLVALSPDMRHIVLSATSLDLETMLLICVPRRVFGMYTAWALGAAYGAAALGFIEGRYPRVLRAVRFIERVFVRTGPLLLVVWPSYTLSSIAGVVRTPFWRFLLATCFGQLFYVLASYYFGNEISELTDAFLIWLRAHVLETTAVCVAAVALQVVLRMRRNAKKRAAAVRTSEVG